MERTSTDGSFSALKEEFERTASTIRRSIVLNWVFLHIGFFLVTVITYIFTAQYIATHQFDVSKAKGNSYYYGNNNENSNLAPKYWSGPMKLSAVWMTMNITILFILGLWVLMKKNVEKYLAFFFGSMIMMSSTCLLMTLVFGIFTIRNFFVWNDNYANETQMGRWGKDNHNIRLASLAFGRLFALIGAAYLYFAFIIYHSREELVEDKVTQYQKNGGYLV